MVSSRRVSVHLDAETASYKRKLAEAGAATSAFGRQVDGSGKEVDKLSGRLRIAADAAAVLGPALAPLGAAAVGGVVALTAQLGALAGGLGVTLLATKGLGDGLDALNKYQLDPSAANAERLRHQLELLGPAGQRFVFFLDSITPELQSLQFAARDGILPGAEEGIQHLLTKLPQLKSLIQSFSNTVGDLLADAGKSLAGKDFEDFFTYLQNDGARILDETARTMGNLAEAAANTFAAFGPLTGDFSGGLLEFSQKLETASEGLSSSKGFQEFLAYIESTGPQALATIEAIANALLQIVEAAAPLGGPVLKALELVANAIARVADSDLGTPIFGALAALALLNRSLAVTQSLTTATFGGPAVAKMRGYVAGLTEVTSAQQRAQMTATELDAANAKTSGNFLKGAGQVALLGASLSGVAVSAGLANTAMLGLLGPWGAAAGVALDLKAAYDGLNDSIDANNAAMGSDSASQLEQRIAATKKQLEDLQNTSLSESIGKGILGGIGAGFLADAQDEIGATTGKTAKLKAQLAEMESELAGVKDGSIQAFNPVSQFGAALQKAAMNAQAEAQALQDAIDAMRAKRQEALRNVNAELNYQQAIDDAKKSLKENGKTVDETTEKGRANLRTLYALADGWNQQGNAAKNAKNSLEDARHNFIQTAQDMGMPIAQAKKLANQLFEIPPKRKSQIEVDAGQALSLIAKVRQELASLHDKTVHVTTVGTTVKAAGGALTHADGGTVAGPRSPYGDKMLYLLAPGEEVVSNRYGQADRHRALLKKINAGRAADGATAGGDRGHHGSGLGSGIFSVDAAANSATNGLKALKEALENARKSIERERQQRDDLIQQRDAFAAQVGSAYSTMDPFAAPEQTGSVWSAGGGMQNPLAAFDAAVAGNTANTQAAQTALATAAANGLDGALYQALAGSGNLQLLQAFANLSAAEIDAREKAFATQSAAQASLGSAAGQAAFGAQLKDANTHLQKIEDRIHVLTQAVHAAAKETGDRVGDKVNGAAASGHRRGQR